MVAQREFDGLEEGAIRAIARDESGAGGGGGAGGGSGAAQGFGGGSHPKTRRTWIQTESPRAKRQTPSLRSKTSASRAARVPEGAAGAFVASIPGRIGGATGLGAIASQLSDPRFLAVVAVASLLQSRLAIVEKQMRALSITRGPDVSPFDAGGGKGLNFLKGAAVSVKEEAAVIPKAVWELVRSFVDTVDPFRQPDYTNPQASSKAALQHALFQADVTAGRARSAWKNDAFVDVANRLRADFVQELYRSEDEYAGWQENQRDDRKIGIPVGG